VSPWAKYTEGMVRLLWMVLLCSAAAVAQSFEAGASFGTADIAEKNASLGTDPTSAGGGEYKMRGGFRFGFRMALNQWRFFGHEFGYTYSRTSIDLPASTSIGTGSGPAQPGSGVVTVTTTSNISVPSHQGFYDFLVYATPEGFRVRPFAAGGVQFTAFSQPNDYYGNRETKYGVNYGGGVKVKVLENWGFRLDVRQYNMGKPFNLANNSGRLLMWEFSGGVSFLL
jgi:opacity protein-like surface antigen